MIYDFKELEQLDNIPYLKEIKIDIKKVISEEYQAILVHKYFWPVKINFFVYLKYFLKLLFQIIFKTKIDFKVNDKIDNDYIFFFDDSHRFDKIRIFNSIIKSFYKENSFSKIENFAKFTSYKIDVISNIIKKIKLSYLFISKYKLLNKINLYDKLNLGSKVLKFVNDYDELKSLKFNQRSKLFFFNQHYYFQNMICQIANTKNITTFSCDHSILEFEKVKYPRMFDNLIYSMSAKYHLCWGEFNKSGFEKNFQKNSIKYLKACHPLRNQYQAQKHILEKNNFSNIILLLGQKKYYKENYEMISLVKKFVKKNNFTYLIKLHPSDNFKRYKNIDFNDKRLNDVINQEKFIVDLIDEKSFCIFFRTSGYFELVSRGVPAFKYINEKNKYFGAETFDNFETLENILINKNTRASWYNDEVLPWIDYLYGNFTNEPSRVYKKIICENK